MHIIHHTANGTGKSYNQDPILDQGVAILPSSSIVTLRVTIDKRLCLKAHAARVSPKLRSSTGWQLAISGMKGASADSLHQIISSTVIPRFLGGSEPWWTGARHVLDQLTPSYHVLTRMITGLPCWCLTTLLLQEAVLPPLLLAMDSKSLWYGTKLLLAENNQPCKTLLLAYLIKSTRPGCSRSLT